MDHAKPLKTVRKRKFRFLFSGSLLAVPLATASFVGIVTGLATVAFVRLIELFQARADFFYSQIAFPRAFSILIMLMCAGLLIGLLSRLMPGASHSQGVPEVLRAIALKGGRIPVVSVLIRAATAVLAIGSGFSVGREGPAVHLGAGIGSNIARVLHSSEMKVKNLAACGAAAGISAVFNAPITGVMFALEVILRDFGARALSTVVVASVAASIVSRIFLGSSPAFAVPPHSVHHPAEIFLYLGLGVLSAVIALSFIFAMDKSDRAFEQVPLPLWARPVLGGLCVGLMGFFFPQVYGMGFHAIEEMLHGRFTGALLLTLVFVKIIATSISLASGSTGGTFGPSLFVGAALGGAFGKLCEAVIPFQISSAGAYALTGMASVFAGAYHAPVTGILLVFEMTGDYQMILPLMASAVVSVSLAQLVRKDCIDTFKFFRQGIDLEHLGSSGLLGAMQVRDAMSGQYAVVQNGMHAAELAERMAKEREKVFFSVNRKNEITGLISSSIINEMLLDKTVGMIIAEDCASPVRDYCFPDEPLGEAALLMKTHQLEALPVMDPERPKQIIGVLQLEDVFRAYTDLAVKREEIIGRIEREGVQESGIEHVRFTVSARSHVAGKMIKEFHLPHGVVLTSIQRGKETLIPQGDTTARVKDKIWATVLNHEKGAFQQWLKKNNLR